MGGCTASRLNGDGAGDQDDPVKLCRERKRLLRDAVERRYALAAAHANYNHSLYAVAAAIDVFVARHSAPTPILTILPAGADDDPPTPATASAAALIGRSSSDLKAPPLGFTHSPRRSSPSDSSSGDDGESSPEEAPEPALEEDEGRGVEMRSGYFFSGDSGAATMAPMSPATEVFGWDFFNPFDGVRAAEEAAAMIGGLERTSDEDLKVVREVEGIPELEEAEEEAERQNSPEKATKVAPFGTQVKVEDNVGTEVVVDYCNEAGDAAAEEKGLALAEMQGKRRELLQTLRDIEDQFIRAFESGKEVSKMLECTRLHFQSGIEEIKENSSKIIQAITWHRSPSSLSSSSRSQLASSSISTTWTESNSDIFDDYGGMSSGSHSQTLGRLYAWEKKLYDEVKDGDRTQQLYEKKCMQLRNQDAKGTDSRSVDKTRTSVRDLYTRILVALRAAESISQRIQKLRDEELQPQIIELLQGLMRSWKIMLESHETQKQIMFEVNTFTCPAYGKYCNESQRLATTVLAAEIRNWRTCFMSYVSAQKAYVEALNGWLSKFLLPDVEYYTRARSSLPSNKAGAPPLVVICHEWFTSLTKLPDKPVSIGMRNFTRTVRFLWAKQGEEIHQKRKVDILAKELDLRIIAYQKSENKIMESKLTENKTQTDVQQRVEYLSGRKELLDIFRKKLDAEKAKHHDCMQETHEITMNGFKIGLASIFESLTEFSKNSLKLYSDLLTHSEKAILADDMSYKSSCIENPGSQMESNGS